jgi:photosystem II stability/assembly factor-like uncharacterized protein
VHFIDLNNGTAVGSNGMILQTTNGGADWYPQNSGINYNLIDVSFSSIENGIVVGYDENIYNAIILKTTNSGQDWSVVYTGTGYLSAVEFIDENTGWAVGDNGKILKTTNGGEDWYPQNSGTNMTLTDVCFTDINTGAAVGMSTILRTTDGGVSWTPQELLLSIHGVSFTDFYNGIIVGGGRGVWSSYSAIYRTEDGGETWTKQLDLSNNTILLAVHFTNTNTGTVVGRGGAILRIADDVTSVNEEVPNVTPTNFLLFQNYPNPFNPSTTISWQSPVGSHQTLKIYDLLGREVATLVDEFKPAGRYEVEFSVKGGSASGGEATDLPSGVYFYRLQAGEYIETKKLLLLK